LGWNYTSVRELVNRLKVDLKDIEDRRKYNALKHSFLFFYNT
jgi:hypothetical protein